MIGFMKIKMRKRFSSFIKLLVPFFSHTVISVFRRINNTNFLYIIHLNGIACVQACFVHSNPIFVFHLLPTIRLIQFYLTKWQAKLVKVEAYVSGVFDTICESNGKIYFVHDELSATIIMSSILTKWYVCSAQQWRQQYHYHHVHALISHSNLCDSVSEWGPLV